MQVRRSERLGELVEGRALVQTYEAVQHNFHQLAEDIDYALHSFSLLCDNYSTVRHISSVGPSRNFLRLAPCHRCGGSGRSNVAFL